MQQHESGKMSDMSSRGFDRGQPASVKDMAGIDQALGSENARDPIGIVLEVSGAGSQIAIDLQRLNECMADPDPTGYGECLACTRD